MFRNICHDSACQEQMQSGSDVSLLHHKFTQRHFVLVTIGKYKAQQWCARSPPPPRDSMLLPHFTKNHRMFQNILR
jgi:hypothetical protein